MAGLLRKILPVVSSTPRDVDDDDAYNVEYSFAMEYHGPPVTHDIPRLVPVDIDQIPTAAAVVSASLLNNLSLPVIQPIVKSNPLSKKSPDRAKLGVEATGSSPNSVIPCEQRATDDSDCVLSSAADSSGMFDSVDGERCAKKSTDGIGSSGSLGFSDSPDHSHDLSESSDVLELPDDCEEISPELGLSSGDPSSEVSSCKEEHRNNGTPRHVKRPSTVTFRDPELSHMVYEESSCDEPEIVQERPPPQEQREEWTVLSMPERKSVHREGGLHCLQCKVLPSLCAESNGVNA
ncbi:hypothetical protein L1049_015003 [Liquidambar formosana]|uniref:Uncharacterized protein n=1 Tax=Liquidambar formosana TaxID=63359 RepID=A0AAP0RY89_LIQFO